MRSLVIAVVLALHVVPAAAQPASPPTPEEMQPRGRSGFWTSPHPAKHGAYRWRLLGLGCALVLTMGLVTWKVVKRANAQRAAAAKR